MSSPVRLGVRLVPGAGCFRGRPQRWLRRSIVGVSAPRCRRPILLPWNRRGRSCRLYRCVRAKLGRMPWRVRLNRGRGSGTARADVARREGLPPRCRRRLSIPAPEVWLRVSSRGDCGGGRIRLNRHSLGAIASRPQPAEVRRRRMHYAVCEGNRVPPPAQGRESRTAGDCGVVAREGKGQP